VLQVGRDTRPRWAWPDPLQTTAATAQSMRHPVAGARDHAMPGGGVFDRRERERSAGYLGGRWGGAMLRVRNRLSGRFSSG
jgi:hypothetical protein